MNCMKCSRALTGDEVALHKKLINRGAEQYMCIDCLAGYLGCDAHTLHRKIAEFRAMGCILFPKHGSDGNP